MSRISSYFGTYSVLPSGSSMMNVAEERLLPGEQSEDDSPEGKLSTFFGVVVPVILSMFSVILFLRLGYVVGQAGLIESTVMFIVAYFVVGLTILSISAIATNGPVKGGGAYFMISRTLGPEFGGSIGVIFYFANIFASALYVLGFVEALISNVGPSGSLVQVQSLKDSTWWLFLYGSVVLLFCLLVCLIGAGMFAKTSFIIFLAVIMSVISSFVSFFAQGKMHGLPVGFDHPKHQNHTYSYTSWNITTLKGNLYGEYGKDYSTDTKQTFLMVFGVLFNGVTGIMAGANMSGDLKNPGRSIPFGTLGASFVTFIIYLLLVLFTSFTCPRQLLKNNYNYLQLINLKRPLITVGVFSATLSAALSCLIGASRILHALAKDNLLGILLSPFAKVSSRNEPLRAVVLSWFFVQVIIIIGDVNLVAPIVSMFFLLSYGVTNLACFALKAASAPNFRPTFQYFNWQTALLGSVSCFLIMFLVRADYAAIAIVLMLILFVVISLRAPATPWGDVGQALIYHQVRKYLLRLDLRKEHVKYWRPQVLLLVSNPRSSYPLIDFVNDIKKSGLYILGNVTVNQFSAESVETHKRDVATWLNFVECAEIKAFVELTISPSLRAGVQDLMMTSGLGGMKPNTVVLGFFDHELPADSLARGIHRKAKVWPFAKGHKDELFQTVQTTLPRLRSHPGDQLMTLKEYVAIIKDINIMGKNICIARHFSQLDKNTLRKHSFIDVWPMNAMAVPEGLLMGPYDFTYLLILQLSCVLHMVPFWEDRTRLRVMMVVERQEGEPSEDQPSGQESLTRLLKELRIPAEVVVIHATDNVSFQTRNADGLAPTTNWYRTVNHLMRIHSGEASVLFTGLPHPPLEDNMAAQYIQDITVLSDDLPPIMMVYGRSPVISTSL